MSFLKGFLILACGLSRLDFSKWIKAKPTVNLKFGLQGSSNYITLWRWFSQWQIGNWICRRKLTPLFNPHCLDSKLLPRVNLLIFQERNTYWLFSYNKLSFGLMVIVNTSWRCEWLGRVDFNLLFTKGKWRHHQ